MTTQAPTDATLDRIAAMTPHQLAQHHSGRAYIAACAADTQAREARITATATHDHAHKLAAQTATAYATRAESAAQIAMRASTEAAGLDTMTDEARAILHTAATAATRASLYADAARTARHAIQLAQEARLYGEA